MRYLKLYNYHGIKLISHIVISYERIIEPRLRVESNMSENCFRFMLGRSTVNAVYILRLLMGKYKENMRVLNMVFIDLNRTYDKVRREVI